MDANAGDDFWGCYNPLFNFAVPSYGGQRVPIFATSSQQANIMWQVDNMNSDLSHVLPNQLQDYI